MADADLIALLLPARPGAAAPLLLSGVMTAWSGAPDYRNTVNVGAVVYQDLAVCNPAAITTTGLAVLLARVPGGAPIVLGPLVRYVPPQTGD